LIEVRETISLQHLTGLIESAQTFSENRLSKKHCFTVHHKRCCWKIDTSNLSVRRARYEVFGQKPYPDPWKNTRTCIASHISYPHKLSSKPGTADQASSQKVSDWIVYKWE
jgi:hypothetical protein